MGKEVNFEGVKTPSILINGGKMRYINIKIIKFVKRNSVTTCPKCNSTNIETLAPGLYRCKDCDQTFDE